MPRASDLASVCRVARCQSPQRLSASTLQKTEVAREWRLVQVPDEDAAVIDISAGLFHQNHEHVYDRLEPFVQLESDRVAPIIKTTKKKNASRMPFRNEKPEKLVINFVWPYKKVIVEN